MFHDVILFMWAMLVIWMMVTGLLLIHEYGHAWAMHKRGIKVEQIKVGVKSLFSFDAFGIRHTFGLLPAIAYCKSADYAVADLKDRAEIAWAGPLVSMLTGVLFYGVAVVTQHWVPVLLVKGSVVLFFINLIPLPPMDGWTIAEYYLSKRGIRLDKYQIRTMSYFGIGVSVLIAFVI